MKTLKMGIATLFAFSCAFAQAGSLSATTHQQPDGLLVLTLSDSAPADMCFGEICAADFTIGFNSAELEFLPTSVTSVNDYGVMGNTNPENPDEILVSFFSTRVLGMSEPNELFSLGFRPLVSKAVSLQIGPRTLGFDDDGRSILAEYPFESVTAIANVTPPVPEPSTALMTLFGLGFLGLMAQKRSSRDRRSSKSA